MLKKKLTNVIIEHEINEIIEFLEEGVERRYAREREEFVSSLIFRLKIGWILGKNRVEILIMGKWGMLKMGVIESKSNMSRNTQALQLNDSWRRKLRSMLRNSNRSSPPSNTPFRLYSLILGEKNNNTC